MEKNKTNGQIKQAVTIPEFIKQKFGESIEAIHKAKETKQQSRDIELESPATVKMTSTQCRDMCEVVKVKYKKGYEERVLSYTCSDDSKDRYGDRINQEGWELDTYMKKNPVILGFHNAGTFPVGNALKVWVEGNKLRAWVLFADKDISEDAETAFQMAKSGFMKSGSVGFLPKKVSHAGNADEAEEMGIDFPFGLLFEKQELLEFSVCSVPANPNAVQEAYTKGLMGEDTARRWLGKTPEKAQEQQEPSQEQKLLDRLEAVEKKLDGLEIRQEVRQGAVLSRKNKTRLNDAVSAMQAAIEGIQTVLKEAEPPEGEENFETDFDTDGGDEVYSDDDDSLNWADALNDEIESFRQDFTGSKDK